MKKEKFCIVISKKDEAGINILDSLKNLGISTPIYITKEDSIFLEEKNEFWKQVKEDFVIFATKHQGKQEKILSIHAPGNWRKADFGGQEGKVCLSSSKILKTFFQELNSNLPERWKATMEATHHGPLINKPCLFIEIGSNKENWKKKIAAEHIAKVIKDSVEKIQKENKEHKEFIPSIAIGGPHYCPNFNKIQLNSKYAISHVIPEYCLPLTKGMLEEAINKTLEKENMNTIILDWKGCGKSEQRQQMIDLIEKNNLKVIRTSEI